MKTIHKTLITAAAVIVIAAGCKKVSFLDAKSTTDLNETSVFTDSVRTMSFLNGIYVNVGNSFNPNRWGGSAGYLDATDECDPRYTGGTLLPNRFAMGTVNSSDAVLPAGSDFFNFDVCYRRIRAVNMLLSKVATTPLAPSTKARIAAEARFLRAWYYAMLMKAYGGVQLLDDKVLGADDNIDIPRSNYADCVSYLVKELDAVAAILPASYSGIDYGRVTKGAAMALKARVLLYAASPLFNGGSIATNPQLIALTAYPTADPQRWQKAADAYLAVINLNQYQLETDNTKAGLGFYKVFLKRMNNEYIFAQMTALNKTLEGGFYPINIGGAGDVYHFPLQNAVDRFGTADGKSIQDPTSGYSDNNPYVNRDPRFYYSIIFNGSRIFTTTGNTQAQVFTYINGAAPNNNPQTSNATILDNTASNTNTKTSYYCRKMCDTTTAVNGGASTERCNPLIRYAEVLLGYAEALNELGQTEQAVDQLKLIRMRAGIKAGTNSRYGIKVGINQTELRDLIQNERSVELMFEEHRFWDVRRWKIAPQTERAEIQGMKITKNGTNYTYERNKQTKQRYWPQNNSYYLMPYTQSELAKLPGILIQNPGW